MSAAQASDGGGVPVTSTETTVDVTYGSAGGPFTVALSVTDKQGANANCSTTVSVIGGGGGTWTRSARGASGGGGD